jgi:hypothetical protein
MKRIEYLRDVDRPRQQVGKKGQVRELPDHVADRLVAGGWAKFVKGTVTKPGKESSDVT